MPSGDVFCSGCGARAPGRRDSMKGMLLDGRYRLETKIAAGGFGAVYRATHMPSGEVVALKILHADIASDPHLSARFRREAAALASLRDPHTVATFDHGEAEDGTLFIAMELLTGRSLFDELHAHGTLEWRRLLLILRGVCSTLIEAHALGIVHRDLKPANINLERRGDDEDYVKVLDFGIAKVMQGSGIDDGADLTRIGQAIGTLEYMSPEQIIGGEVDGRSDIYTLGVVAYEMLTGRRPFAEASGPTSLMTALMTRTPMPPSALFHRGILPAEVDRLILRCLASDPEDRFDGAADLAAAIDGILRSSQPRSLRTTLPGSAPYVAPHVPSPRPSARVSAALAAAAAAPAAGVSAARPAARVSAAHPAVYASAANASAAHASAANAPAAHVPGARPAVYAARSPVSFATLGSFEDEDDDTTVDGALLLDGGGNLGARARMPLPARSRTPYLAVPPDLSDFRASAEGSTVGPPPSAPVRRRRSVLEIAAWAGALVASGVGVGLLVAAFA